MISRRFVHLVLGGTATSRRVEYSLRNIHTSRFFYPARPPPCPVPLRPPEPPSNLPPPAMCFSPPRSSTSPGEAAMEFMLLGRDHKVLAADQTGRALLYDPARHTVRTVPKLSSPKHGPVVSIPVPVPGPDGLYIMNAIPNLPSTLHLGGHDHGFDQLVSGRDPDDWRCCELPAPVACEEDVDAVSDPRFGVITAAATVAGDVWVSKEGMGTYSLDGGRWTKAGEWMLPFAGLAEFVPDHGLWFGLTSQGLLCAADLGPLSSTTTAAPEVRGLWEHVAPPGEWGWLPEASRLVHVGSGARFCVTSFFTCQTSPAHRFAVFAGVEVEQCGGGDRHEEAAGLRMLMHRSEVYLLPREIKYWVL